MQPHKCLTALVAPLRAAVGRKKVLQLKLEAQKLLCQRQVEINTRVTAKPEALSAAAGQ